MPGPDKNPAAPAPPGTEALFSVTCKDVVMGRGSGTQNHCGNVTYRKLVFLNKELYATSSKFDKLKISKAIVAAVREFGGHFVQADEKRGGLYYDIGDKRAWDKTSQALREGQADIRAKLAAEDPDGMNKIAEYKQVISEQTFFAYACKMMESLYHPVNGDSGITACSGQCPHARRRQTLNQSGANPMQIYNAMQNIAMPALPPVSGQQQGYNMQYGQPFQNNTMAPGGMNQVVQPYHQADLNIEPLPYNAPSKGGEDLGSIDPLPYNHPAGSEATYLSSLATSAQPASTDNIEPLPFANHRGPTDMKIPKPGLMNERLTSSGTVFSIRKFCSEDFEMSSAEGKQLMEQLNQEVDDLIRRKSYGLIQIDTTPFEDLVFEEDSMDLFDDPKANAGPATAKSSAPATMKDRLSSSSTAKSSTSTPGLSFKDDMSLMNMSILTLDEKDEDERSGSKAGSGSKSSGGGDTPTSIMRQNDPSVPKNVKKRGSTRVSFAGRNISLMSMDERSFSQLVDRISDPDEDRNMSGMTVSSNESQRSISRKMGFPMRKTVADKFETGGLPPEKVSSLTVTSQDKVSGLSISEDASPDVKSEGEFTKMAGKVKGTAGVGNSLKLDVSINNTQQNVSALNMGSAMSLASDFDPELLK